MNKHLEWYLSLDQEEKLNVDMKIGMVMKDDISESVAIEIVYDSQREEI